MIVHRLMAKKRILLMVQLLSSKNSQNIARGIDFSMNLSQKQKGVDMRIGIDVATLSLKGIADRIISISAT